MENKLPTKNLRVKEVIQYFSNGNVSKFASQLDNISQQRLNRLFLKSTRSNDFPGVPEEIISAIIHKFPVNPAWLLTGEGSMLLNQQDNSLTEPKKSNQVPFHQDVVLTATATESYNGKISHPIFINLGDAFSDATGAMQVSGHSMYPTYENGCIVGYREVNDKTFFLPGEVYIIGTPDMQVIKRVQKSDIKGCILLTSDNEEKRKDGRFRYEDKDVEIDRIRFMAIVLGKISRIQMKLINK